MRAICLLTLSLTAVLAFAAPAAGGGARFATYVSCSAAADDHDSVCSLGASPVAVFRSLRRPNVGYRVCVRRPNGERRCRDKRSGRTARR